MEDERKIIEKRMLIIALSYSLVLTVIVVWLYIVLQNLNVIFLFLSLPIPLTLFSKELVRNYSKKYKETVIRHLFLSYFDSFVIDTEKKYQIYDLKKTGFLPFKKQIEIDTEDFITLTHKGKTIQLQEILLKQGNEIGFKGLLFSMDLKPYVNQIFTITHQTNKYINKFFGDEFQTLKINDINVLYQGEFDIELSRPFIEIARSNQISISIQNNKIHCLIPSDGNTVDEKMEMFEPMLTSEYNSSSTYSFIQSEYFRINKISKIILKLEEINVA